ncbi:TraK domain-containing protein [Endozoicomonas arenosclerae]|uniref:TraK domain-containing protein n=1 Tax=Endozoicomonas arenosclerae TaxID=1633495 RepID=UPI00078412A4|nr:type-F conjugative transfer system secretin TraK [Endozoicomonas arenosclerae]
MNKAFAAIVCCSVCLYSSMSLAGSTPVKLQVSPGQQQTVTLSRLHLNRIVTPFTAPQIRTIDQADIRIEGSVIYLSSQQEEPFVVYITPHDSEAHALSLLVTPLDVPPKEIQLSLSKQWQQKINDNNGIAKRFEEASDYQQSITEVLSTLVKGQVPEGYELNQFHEIHFQSCQQDGLTFDFSKGQQIQGHHFHILVGTCRNTTEKPITFKEHSCKGSHTAAVSMWPNNTLYPGQRRELFILLNAPNQASVPLIRPSLLTH